MLESGSIISSSITLAVAAIGAGMLAFPLAFANLGLVAASCSLAVIAFFTVVSFYYLALGVERLGLCSYEDLTRVLLGPKQEKAIRVMLVALNFGVAVCYVVVISEMLAPLQPEIARHVAAFFGDSSVVGSFIGTLVSTRARCLTLVWAMVMLPLSLTRSMAALRYTTALAICASVFIVMAVVYREHYPSADQGSHTLDFQLWNGARNEDGRVHGLNIPRPQARSHSKVGKVNYASNTAVTPGSAATGDQPLLISTDSAGATDDVNTIFLFNVHAVMFLALPIIGYSLDCQCFVFQLYCDLKPSIRSAWSMGKVAGLSMMLACVMYFLIGTFGYLSFGDHTKGNILQNYHPTEDLVMAFGYGLYSIPVVMAYALTIFPLRDAIFNYLYGVSAAEQESVIPSFSFYSWSVAVSTATLVFGILTPGIVVIIGLLGAICSSTLCFILPARYRIQMHRKGLLPYGCKNFSDPTEALPVAEMAYPDSKRQQDEVQKILQHEEGAATSYGSIVDIHSSSEAELAAIAVQGKDISIPLSPTLDSALAHTMLWLGIVSGILGTVAAFLNIVVGIGE